MVSLPGFRVLARSLPGCEKQFLHSATCLTCCSKAARRGGLASLPGTAAHSFLALARASRNREGASMPPWLCQAALLQRLAEA